MDAEEFVFLAELQEVEQSVRSHYHQAQGGEVDCRQVGPVVLLQVPFREGLVCEHPEHSGEVLTGLVE